MSYRKQDFLIAFLLFLCVLVIYVTSKNTAMSDTLWSVHISGSLLYAGDVNLDEFEQIVATANNYGVLSRKINDHIVPYFPVGNSILGAPLLFVLEKIFPPPTNQNIYEYMQQRSYVEPYIIWMQHLIAAIIAALIAPLFYFIARIKYRASVAVVAVLVFAFASSAFSVASRVLWQHGPSMLMISLTLLLFLKGQKQPGFIRWAGIPLAFSFVIRPTNGISIFVLTLFVLLYYRKQLVGFLFGAACVAIPFLWFNLANYGQWFSPYYLPQRVRGSSTFYEALAGNLVSPSRGLLVYSPVLLFIAHTIYLKWRNRRWYAFDTALALIIILHWLLISSFGHWYGGHSYGPRFFSDVLPYLFYFLLPSLNWLMSPPFKSLARMAGIAVFMALTLISVTIHSVGANEVAINSWNDLPVSLDPHADVRLWDWSDLQFLRTAQDWPIEARPYHIGFDREAYDQNPMFSLVLQNRADVPYAWELKTPEMVSVLGSSTVEFIEGSSGLSTVRGKAPLPAGEIQVLQLALQSDLEGSDSSSLGAISLITKDPMGADVSVQIIPVSISENGRNWQSSFALAPYLWLPEDITVQQQKPISELYGLFGVGWYLPERFEAYRWRWSQSPSELYVFSSKPREATFTFTLSEIYDDEKENGVGENGWLQIQTNEQTIRKNVDKGQQAQFSLLLDPGWNVLTFSLEAGNFRPSDLDPQTADQRMLSFAMSSLDIAVENDWGWRNFIEEPLSLLPYNKSKS